MIDEVSAHIHTAALFRLLFNEALACMVTLLFENKPVRNIGMRNHVPTVVSHEYDADKLLISMNAFILKSKSECTPDVLS